MYLEGRQSTGLNEIAWDESGRGVHEDISAWGQIKHSAKCKSLEIKTTRPKLMLPRPIRVKKRFRNVVVSPQPSQQLLETAKVEGIIFKLIEKSRKTAEKLKKIGQKPYGDKLLTKIPFLNYKLNLPRSLNTLKTPSTDKRIRNKTVIKPLENSFDYYLNGKSYTMKGPTSSPSNYLRLPNSKGDLS